MEYPHILIPVDGSKESAFACKLAVELTDSIPGQETIHLVHCLDPIPNLIGGEDRAALEKDNRKKANDLFAPYIERFNEIGNPCTTHIIYDARPGRGIAQAAEEMKCNMIIMGTRGIGAIKSALLGSVSRDVLEYAEVPVLLVRDGKGSEIFTKSKIVDTGKS